MAKQVFKGFRQVVSGGTFENGYIYLVREDAMKERGYIYFNGKKYGTTQEVAETLSDLSSGLSEEISAREVAISGLQAELATQVSALTEEDVADVKLEERPINGVSGETKPWIYIERKDGTKTGGFDASAFVIDGMLSNVTYDSTAHTMTFIWNTDAGHTDLTIDLDDVIAPYNADEATIHKGDNNTFSAIMDEAGGVASHSALTAEATAREQAISGVQGQISAEATAREQAISGVQGQISAEVSARTAAISGVQGQINDLTATKSGESYGVQVEVAQEHGVLTSVSVDATGIHNAITAETQARETAISGVQGQISAEVSARTAAISGVQGQITAEATAREQAISGVQGQINSLDATLSASSNGVQVEITQTDGKLTDLTVTAPEAAQHTSQDKSIKITTGTQGVDFGLNRETATDTTVAAGHLEVALNASGETYAVMYYDGNDTEPAN